MTIKSLDDLRRIRENNQSKIRLRHGEGSADDETEILVGMATCGIAAGARATMNALVEELAERHIAARVIPVGCMGSCPLEPVVVIMEPGQKPFAYGKLDAAMVPTLVESHLRNHIPIAEWMVELPSAIKEAHNGNPM